MIYLKRLWNALVTLFALIMGLICLPLILIEATIVAFVYYIATGTNYMSNHQPIAYYVASFIVVNITFDID